MVGDVFRTDLAVEAREMIAQEVRSSVEGIVFAEREDNGVRVTEVRVMSEAGAKTIGKKIGSYVTLEASGMRRKDAVLERTLTKILAREIGRMIPREGTVLVVGLGNRSSTPDALGPRTVEEVFVTRHMREVVSTDLAERLRSVCAIAPGVLGVTGIETAEILEGVVRSVRPAVIIAVDALASSASERIATTIQLSDTGIHPGSGVGNRRAGIDEESMGVPVIAVGVPTVIYASTIGLDVLHGLERGGQVVCRFARGERVTEARRRTILKENMPPELSQLMVTPRDIDRLVADMAKVIAAALNEALQPTIKERYLSYLQ